MAASFVQAASGYTDLGTTAVTGTDGSAFGSNVTAGNTIVVAARWNDQTDTCTISDNLGNTYATLVARIQHGGGTGNLQLYVAYNINGGACTITATTSSGSFSIGIVALEATGVPTTDPTDTGISSTDNAEAGTAIDTGAVTPSQNGCLVVAASTVISGAGTYTADSRLRKALRWGVSPIPKIVSRFSTTHRPRRRV